MPTPSDRATNQPVFDIDPAFGPLAVAMGEAVWGLPHLSLREKALLCLANDTCRGDFALPFQMHVRMALANGVAAGEIREVLYYLARESGYPNTLSALARLREIELPATPGPASAAPESREPSARAEAVAEAGALDPAFASLLDAEFAKLDGHRGITRREQAYLSITADVCFGTLGAPFRHHVQEARLHGAGDRELRAVLSFLAEFGFSRVWEAFIALEALDAAVQPA